MAIAVLFADGFEEIEATTIVDVLRRADFDVIMTGVQGTEQVGAHGIAMKMDRRLDELDRDVLQAVVLPGGTPGAYTLRDHPAVQDLLKDAALRGLTVAAICAAPIALERAGLILGKKVTSYPSFADQVPSATHTGAAVVVDGRIITGSGPGTALAFALQLVRELGKPDAADTLRKGMLA